MERQSALFCLFGCNLGLLTHVNNTCVKGLPTLSAGSLGASLQVPYMKSGLDVGPNCLTPGLPSPLLSMDCFAEPFLQKRGRLACTTGYGPKWNVAADLYSYVFRCPSSFLSFLFASG